MLKRKQYQIHSFFQRHDKTCHTRLCQCNRIAILNLLNPKRDNGSTTAHYISITGTADLCFSGHSGFCYCNFFFNRFCNTHGINRISRFICRKTDHRLYTFLNCCSQNIFCTDNIRTNCFHREKLTGRNLF